MSMTEPVPSRPAAPARAAVPDPGPEAIAHSERLLAAVGQQIRACGGGSGGGPHMQRGPFRPGPGYYAGETGEIGAHRGLVPAPQISPPVSAALAARGVSALTQL